MKLYNVWLLACLTFSIKADFKPAPLELLRMIDEDLTIAGIFGAENRQSTIKEENEEEGNTDDLNAGEEFVEGDMLEIESDENADFGAATSEFAKWPKKEVPFTIDKRILDAQAMLEKEGKNDKGYKAIKDAMEEFEKRTCISFRNANSKDKHKINILPGRGCYSYVGRQRNKASQSVSVGRGCQYKGIVMHELMHALGFYHEQARADRDIHVKILKENIQMGKERNFKSYSRLEIDDLDEGYDTCSIMHYGLKYFSKNLEPTIQVIRNINKCHVGQRKILSEGDLRKLNKLYKCEDELKKLHATKTNCKGGDDCCTKNNKCARGEGDCDKNEHCQAGLICGEDNCPGRKWFGNPDLSDDCCCVEGVDINCKITRKH